MPEISVNEQGNIGVSKDKVGTSGQIASVLFKLQARISHQFCNDAPGRVLQPRMRLIKSLRLAALMMSPRCEPSTGELRADQDRCPGFFCERFL